jgi:hypothetical protein
LRRRGRTAPDQHNTIFVNREALCLDNLSFEILKIFIVQVEAPFQSSIRDSPLTLQQVEHVSQHLIECHTSYSTGS